MRVKECLFCELQKQRELILIENKWGYVIKDKYPSRKGHLLIITKQHYASYFETPLVIKQHLWALVEQAQIYLAKTYAPSGYRIQVNCQKDGMQEIFHTHIHLIPAYPDSPFIKKSLPTR